MQLNRRVALRYLGLAALGIEPAMETPEAFARLIVADCDRSAGLLSAANFHPE